MSKNIILVLVFSSFLCPKKFQMAPYRYEFKANFYALFISLVNPT
jgi:hypothetical protein